MIKRFALQPGLIVYARLLNITRQYWPLLLLGVLGTLVVSLLDSGLTWLLKPIMNEGLIARNVHFLRWLPLIIIVAFVCRGVATFMSSFFIQRISRNVVMYFRQALFAKYLKLPCGFFDQHNSGNMLSTIIYNVEQVSSASAEALLVLLRESTFLIGLIVVMFNVSWRLSLFFFIITPFVLAVIRFTSARMQRLSSNVQETVGDVTKIADSGIHGQKIIKLFGAQALETQRMQQAVQYARHRELKIVVTNSISTSIVQVLLGVPIAGVLFFVTIPSMHVSPGSFAAVITAMISLLRPVRRLTSVNSILQRGVAGAKSIFTVLDYIEESDKKTHRTVRAAGKVSFKQVRFRYENTEQDVLHGIDLDIQPGETVALVGRSGSGKSTLANLLPRFYLPYSGSVELDGVNINEYDLNNLRAQLSFVSQETVLFDCSVAENIQYALPELVSEQALIEAAKAACAWSFIQELPQGLDTRIGQEGVLLSGGQRQRIAIARALLRNAPVLILDEATSSLDNESERHIQQALQSLLQDRTTLVIAHRLSTVENADRIVVVADGAIVEQGTHQSLLTQQGVYTQLYQTQFNQAAETVGSS